MSLKSDENKRGVMKLAILILPSLEFAARQYIHMYRFRTIEVVEPSAHRVRNTPAFRQLVNHPVKYSRMTTRSMEVFLVHVGGGTDVGSS